jgi:hypothetical protein
MEAAASQLKGRTLMPMPELLKTKGTQSSADSLSDVDSPPAEEEGAVMKSPDALVLEEATHNQDAGVLDPAQEMINQSLEVEVVDMNPTVAVETVTNTNTNPGGVKQAPQPEVPQARAIPRASETEATPAEVREVRQELRKRIAEARNRGKPQSQPRGVRKQPLPGRVFTPVMPTLPETKANTKYYDLRFFLEESQDPRGQLFGRIETVMMALFERDPTITLYPYLAENREEQIETLNAENWNEMREADSLVLLQRYFHKAIEYYGRGGFQTVRILMSHDKTFDWLLGELSNWMYNNGYGLYEKSLQVENSIVVGWAYMSTDKINRDEFAEEISHWCGFPVGLQWRNVTHYGQSKRFVKAIHFDVEKKHASHDRRVLGALYEYKRKAGWPFGMRMRFVPELNHGANREAKQSCMRLRRKQANIVAFMQHKLTEHLVNVDHVSKALGNRSVRQFLMNVKCREKPTLPLFTAINQQWKNSKYWVSYLPQNKKEAEAVIDSVLPFTRSRFPDSDTTELDLLFDPAHAMSMDDCEWSDARGGVVAWFTKQVEETDKNPDDEVYFEGMEKLEESDEETVAAEADDNTDPTPARRGRKRVLLLENESVGTIAANTMTGQVEDVDAIHIDKPTPAPQNIERSRIAFASFRAAQSSAMVVVPDGNEAVATPAAKVARVTPSRAHYESTTPTSTARRFSGRSEAGRSYGGRGRTSGGRRGGY